MKLFLLKQSLIACLVFATFASTSASAKNGNCLRLVFDAVASSNPFESLMQLKPGTPVRLRLGEGPLETFEVTHFDPTTDVLELRRKGGGTLRIAMPDLLEAAADGSIEFPAGKGVDLNMPARNFAKIGGITDHLAHDGIRVVWENADLADDFIRGDAKRFGIEPPSVLYNGTKSGGLNEATISVSERATLGAFLHEVEVARRWVRGIRSAEAAHRGAIPALFPDHSSSRALQDARARLSQSWMAVSSYSQKQLYVDFRSGDLARWQRSLVEFETLVRDYRDGVERVAFTAEERARFETQLGVIDQWLRELKDLKLARSRNAVPAQEPVPARSYVDALRWKQETDQFARKSAENMKKMLPRYREAKARGEPLIRLLESLGYNLSEPPIIPPLGQILVRLRQLMEALVASGQISHDEVLLPSRIAKSATGELIFLKEGEGAPPGAVMQRTLEEADYIAALAAGYFPIGEATNIIATKDISALEHDIAHFSAFIEHPRYMAAMRRAARALRDSPTATGNQLKDLKWRTHVLTEILALGNPATADAIMRAVGLVRVEQHGSLTVSEVAKHLKTYSPDKMRQVLARLRDLYPRSIRYFGGAMADIAHRTDPKANVRIGIEDMIVGRWEKHKAKIDAIISGQPYISDPIFTEDLARVIVGLVESSKVDPERIFDEALVHKPDPGTATYQWLCASGFLTNTEFVNAFCR